MTLRRDMVLDWLPEAWTSTEKVCRTVVETHGPLKALEISVPILALAVLVYGFSIGAFPRTAGGQL